VTDAEVAAELRAAIPRVVRTGSSPLWHSLLMSARAEWAYLDSLPAERFGIGWTRWASQPSPVQRNDWRRSHDHW